MECDINTYKLKKGDNAPNFTLKGVDGKEHSLSEFTSPVLIVFFGCNHCPYVIAYDNRVMDLVEEFSGKADFVEINSNDEINYPQDSFDNMVSHAQEKGFKHAYLRDESQEVAHAYGGQCTPHFFVFDKDRKIVYQGTLDDNLDGASDVQKNYLRDAIVSVLESGEAPEFTGAIGCSVKWKN